VPERAPDPVDCACCAVAASVARQLAAMEAWTLEGRTPTPEERRQINIGLIAVRELEPLDQPELTELIDALRDINYAFETWPRSMNA
jgi:hypothetical protein